MLNPFPLMWLSPGAYFLLRLFIGGVFLVLALRHWRHRGDLRAHFRKTIPRMAAIAVLPLIIFEFAVGFMFVAGWYTQIAALLTVVFALKMLIMRRKFPRALLPQPMVFVLLVGIALSLFITGAGLFAFDMPI